ncbi:MAG TPA: hypothetical protein VMM18_04515 [Gemmatimonadaceae bacterium]|nr:hypothetical protein [Gemmatimonadaceae bacterium]
MHRCILKGLAVSLLVAGSLGAQGNVGPLVLALPGGARAQSLGGAGVALSDHESIFDGPAQLAIARGAGVAVQRYGGASTYAAMSAAMAFFGGGVGIGVQWLDFWRASEPLFETGGEPDLLERGDDLASDVTAMLGYARTVRGFRVGLLARYVGVRHTERGGTFAADLGVARTIAFTTIALSAQHLGQRLTVADQRIDLPRRYTLGVATRAYPLHAWFDITAAAAIPVLEDGTVLPGGGIELSYVPIEGVSITGRVGARAVRRGTESPYTAGASAGFDGIFVEYAYQQFEVPGSAHRIGIRVVP